MTYNFEPVRVKGFRAGEALAREFFGGVSGCPTATWNRYLPCFQVLTVQQPKLLYSTLAGVACHPPPHAKHGPVLTFTAPHRPPPRPHRIAFATNREHKGQQIGSASARGSAAHVIHGDFPQNPLSRVKRSSNAEIARTLHVSIPYAASIRLGRRQPHPRHWKALSSLVGIAG